MSGCLDVLPQIEVSHTPYRQESCEGTGLKPEGSAINNTEIIYTNNVGREWNDEFVSSLNGQLSVTGLQKCWKTTAMVDYLATDIRGH